MFSDLAEEGKKPFKVFFSSNSKKGEKHNFQQQSVLMGKKCTFVESSKNLPPQYSAAISCLKQGEKTFCETDLKISKNLPPQYSATA